MPLPVRVGEPGLGGGKGLIRAEAASRGPAGKAEAGQGGSAQRPSRGWGLWLWGGSSLRLATSLPPLPSPPTCAQDEQSTLQLLKKHLVTEQTVENYAETIAQLSRQCRALLELSHPDR